MARSALDAGQPLRLTGCGAPMALPAAPTTVTGARAPLRLDLVVGDRADAAGHVGRADRRPDDAGLVQHAARQAAGEVEPAAGRRRGDALRVLWLERALGEAREGRRSRCEGRGEGEEDTAAHGQIP